MAIAAATAATMSIIIPAVGIAAYALSKRNTNSDVTTKFRWIKVTITNGTSFDIRYTQSEKEFEWGKFCDAPAPNADKSPRFNFSVCNRKFVPTGVSGKIKFELILPEEENIPISIAFSNPLVGPTVVRAEFETEDGRMVDVHRGFRITSASGDNNAIVAITGEEPRPPTSEPESSQPAGAQPKSSTSEPKSSQGAQPKPSTSKPKSSQSAKIRRREVEEILRKHPHKVPIIVERHKDEKQLAVLDNPKFLVPEELTFGQLTVIIRQRLQLSHTQSFYLIVNNRMVASTSRSVADIYCTEKDPDGFLHVAYFSSQTFGGYM